MKKFMIWLVKSRSVKHFFMKKEKYQKKDFYSNILRKKIHLKLYLKILRF